MLSKKVAMFGLFRTLKKQSSELFLAKRHSVDSQETRGSHKIKRGAMFGLDARIALAIFGALSVISGAALYSAIKSAKAERFRQYFENYIKASEHYLLDNGTYLPQYNDHLTYNSDLVVNRQSLSAWTGPYLDGSKLADYKVGDIMRSEIGANSGSYIYIMQSSTWSVNTAPQKCSAVGDVDCAEYIAVTAVIAAEAANLLKMFNSLDELVDGSDGKLAGDVRYIEIAGYPHYLAYKSIPRKRSI